MNEEIVIRLTETVPISRINELLALDTICEKDKKKLLAYLKKRIGKTDNFAVEYHYSRNTVNEGRLFAGGCGLQNFERNIRNFLCYGVYLDSDMVNAVPSILGNLVRIHNLTCTNVSAYSNRRPEILEETGWDKHKVIKMIFYNKPPNNAPKFFLICTVKFIKKLFPF